jgi:RHS repeat-associated protein
MQTDYQGNAELQCQGDSFGDALICSPITSNAADATEIHFTGKERDNELGLDYFGARYYASSMGRFMSPDPSGLYFANPFNPQSLNLYNYGLNNPLINTDPTGLDCVHINNDTGAYEGFESGDCDNSTAEKANSGYYVDGKVSNIRFNGQGQVTGYDADTSSGLFNSYAGSLNPGATAANLNRIRMLYPPQGSR